MTDLQQMLENTKQAVEAAAAGEASTAQDSPPGDPLEKALAELPEKVPEEPKLFRQYISARVAMKLVTPIGRVITFTKHRFITDDPQLISHLNKRIKSGKGDIREGDSLETNSLDPMAAYRQQVIKEYLAEQEAARAALPKTKDMGSTVAIPVTKVVTSSNVAN